MFAFVVRRLLISIPLIFLSSFLVFVLVATAPGDPLADLRLGRGDQTAAIELRRQQLDLDEPVVERYFSWVGDAVQGDLGRSISNEEISSLIWRRLGVTMRLVAFATVISVILA